jgi:hypothetical protein
MFDQPEPVIAAFRGDIPRDFLTDLLTALFESYRDAFDMCMGHMDHTEMLDVLAANRRALIETNLRAVGHRYSGITVQALQNPRKTSHFSLFSSGVLDLTVSKSGSSNCMPRHAVYRRNLFRLSQASLFQDSGPNHSAEARLYALVLHGPWRRKQLTEENASLIKYPAFARAVFPDSDGQILTGVDLFRECRSVVNHFIPPIEKVEIAKPAPIRKRKAVSE